MGQVLHGSAKTTHAIRGELQRSQAPVVYGWVQVAHQFGAATAAFGAGLTREITGEYNLAFVAAGAAALLTMIIMWISAQNRLHETRLIYSEG